MKRILFVLLLTAIAGSVHAEAFRCGTRLVTDLVRSPVLGRPAVACPREVEAPGPDVEHGSGEPDLPQSMGHRRPSLLYAYTVFVCPVRTVANGMFSALSGSV